MQKLITLETGEEVAKLIEQHFGTRSFSYVYTVNEEVLVIEHSARLIRRVEKESAPVEFRNLETHGVLALNVSGDPDTIQIRVGPLEEKHPEDHAKVYWDETIGWMELRFLKLNGEEVIITMILT